MSVDLAPRVLAAIRRHSLLREGDRVLVAVSGGADSLALLHVLHDLTSTLGITLHVAHLEHGLRGEQSVEDARFVEREAARLGWPVAVERVRVAEIAASARLSLETAARQARYAFFERAAREAGCTCVATGHTADDRVETMLLNLLRGTGLDGLCGIPRQRPLGPSLPPGTAPEGEGRLVVVRPLLDIHRAETEAYCRARGLVPREDPTNQALTHTRNRVRHRVLPFLEAEATPGLRDRLLTLAELVAAEVEHLEAGAAQVLRAAIRDEGPAQLTLAVAPLTAAPAVLARRALRQAAARLGVGDTMSYAATDAFLRLVTGELPTGITLPGGRVRVVRRGEVVVLDPSPRPPPRSGEGESDAARSPFPPLRFGEGGKGGGVKLPVPGHTSHLGYRFAAREIDPPAVPAGDPARRVLLDAEKLSGELRIRAPRPGDRIRPLGMAGQKKLHDLFVDAKLPRDWRASVPVVADGEKIVWVVGFCLSDEVRLDPTTRHALRLEAEPSPSPATGQAVARPDVV